MLVINILKALLEWSLLKRFFLKPNLKLFHTTLFLIAILWTQSPYFLHFDELRNSEVKWLIFEPKDLAIYLSHMTILSCYRKDWKTLGFIWTKRRITFEGAVVQEIDVFKTLKSFNIIGTYLYTKNALHWLKQQINFTLNKQKPIVQ